MGWASHVIFPIPQRIILQNATGPENLFSNTQCLVCISGRVLEISFDLSWTGNSSSAAASVTVSLALPVTALTESVIPLAGRRGPAPGRDSGRVTRAAAESGRGAPSPESGSAATGHSLPSRAAS